MADDAAEQIENFVTTWKEHSRQLAEADRRIVEQLTAINERITAGDGPDLAMTHNLVMELALAVHILIYREQLPKREEA